MASDSGGQARGATRAAMLSRIRTLLRTRPRAVAGSEALPAMAGRWGVGANLREHRLDDDAELPFVAASLVVGDDGREALHAHEPAHLGVVEAVVERALRDEADAVLVGAGALRSGRFERSLGDPRRRSPRRGQGLTLDPIGIVVARGECDVSVLVGDPAPATPVLLYTDAPDPLPFMHCVEVTRMATSDLTPRAVLAHARRAHGVRTVLYEGGSQMLAALLRDGALDELVLTIVPGIEPDLEQPPITDLPGFAELAADRTWETDAGPTILRLHPA